MCASSSLPNSRDEHVIGDVVQMTSVFQPGPCHADVVCGTLSFDLKQQKSILDILPVPLIKRSQQLETVAKIHKQK